MFIQFCRKKTEYLNTWLWNSLHDILLRIHVYTHTPLKNKNKFRTACIVCFYFCKNKTKQKGKEHLLHLESICKSIKSLISISKVTWMARRQGREINFLLYILPLSFQSLKHVNVLHIKSLSKIYHTNYWAMESDSLCCMTLDNLNSLSLNFL